MSEPTSRAGISHHFRREAKLMVGLFVAVVLLGILAAMFGPQVAQYIAVDRCLDSGGRSNYASNTCEASDASPRGASQPVR